MHKDDIFAKITLIFHVLTTGNKHRKSNHSIVIHAFPLNVFLCVLNGVWNTHPSLSLFKRWLCEWTGHLSYEWKTGFYWHVVPTALDICMMMWACISSILSTSSQVFVEFEDCPWRQRSWVHVYGEDVSVVLVESAVVWAARSDATLPEEGAAASPTWPALVSNSSVLAFSWCLGRWQVRGHLRWSYQPFSCPASDHY